MSKTYRRQPLERRVSKRGERYSKVQRRRTIEAASLGFSEADDASGADARHATRDLGRLRRAVR